MKLHPCRLFVRQVGTYWHRTTAIMTGEPVGPVFKAKLGQCQVCGRLFDDANPLIGSYMPHDPDQPECSRHFWTPEQYGMAGRAVPKLQRDRVAADV